MLKISNLHSLFKSLLKSPLKHDKPNEACLELYPLIARQEGYSLFCRWVNDHFSDHRASKHSVLYLTESNFFMTMETFTSWPEYKILDTFDMLMEDFQECVSVHVVYLVLCLLVAKEAKLCTKFL